MVVSPRCLERGLSPTPSHHQCEGRPLAFPASRATRAINSAEASAACLEGPRGPLPHLRTVLNSTRRANHLPIIRNAGVCPVPSVKIFCFSEMANHSRIVAILTRQEGRFANVSNVGQVAVDVGGSSDDWNHFRTAKPWGPDTPTLVSSLRDAIPASDGG